MQALRRGIAPAGDRFVLTLDPAFQGLPDTAHGGSVLAAFDTVAAGCGPRALIGHYRRRVPLDVPLTLTRTPDGPVPGFALADAAGALLVDGRVEPRAAEAAVPSFTGVRALLPLPVSRSCLACGIDNALGLQARLAADDRVVTATWTPRPALCVEATVAPVALTTLLDETAFWLGALASGESGMTTELGVTLHADVAAGAPITVWGDRADTRPSADDARYWRTRALAVDPGGRLVASATITFVAVRGAARRLAAALLALNPAEVVYRVFPAYAR
jgi:hypothetical protein